MSTPEPLLTVNNVGLTFNGFGWFNKFRCEALSDVSFDVFPGEVFGVMGRNGCGKSTLLRVLSGVIKPTEGSVQLQRAKLTRALLTLGLGFKPQLSGRDNALLGCMLQGASKREARAMLKSIQEFSELEDFFDQPVKTYSSGMRARLGFSTALTTNVDLLLIDETLSVGDSAFNKKAETALLSKINSSQTVIFVSHNEKQVERLCKRAIWLEGGLINASGATKDVSSSYREFMHELRVKKTKHL
mgnify:CR=1 FL=1